MSSTPLGKMRWSRVRMVPAASECLGGGPSGAGPRGLLYQPSSVSQDSGVSRPRAVSHSVAGEGAMVVNPTYG